MLFAVVVAVFVALGASGAVAAAGAVDAGGGCGDSVSNAYCTPGLDNISLVGRWLMFTYLLFNPSKNKND